MRGEQTDRQTETERDRDRQRQRKGWGTKWEVGRGKRRSGVNPDREEA